MTKLMVAIFSLLLSDLAWLAAEASEAAEPKLLLGDLGGLRPTLAASGFELGITYIGTGKKGAC